MGQIVYFTSTDLLLICQDDSVCVSLFQYFSESKMMEKNQFSLIRKYCVVGMNLHVTKTAMLQVSSINKF